MLIPNNPDLDFQDLNRRIEAEAKRYRAENNNEQIMPSFNPAPEVDVQSYDWSLLILLDDEALIKAAYPTLLGRIGQQAEIERDLQHLRAGVEKFQVLAALRYSSEGRVHDAKVFGLRRAHLKNVIQRIPFMGSLWTQLHVLFSAHSRHSEYETRLTLLGRQYKLPVDHVGAYKDRVQYQLATWQQQAHAQQIARERQQLQLFEMQQHFEHQSTQVQELHTHLFNLQTVLDEHHQTQQLQAQATEHLTAELQQTRQVEQELRMRMSHMERAPVSSTTAKSTQEDIVPVSSVVHAGLPDSFYLAFENRFRGTVETIRSRLSYYLPLLDEVAPLQSGLPLVDVGCGRGEWLQMLSPKYQRFGLDLNALNIETCKEQGLNVLKKDALIWLADQADNSVAVITAFHVIEHLTFEQFNLLLDQCLRTLAPGGLVIFETPNPENLIVAATNFYTDPTHLHPLPPAFTEFMLQFKGFDQVAIHRLNPIPPKYIINEDNEVSRRCDALFYGPQDYAVTASKQLIRV
ncbi:bifunctional 2-polyprenyl-6-hydroxyphenol methylase/3-demethylubiquinol 3-O-methyltransferase UbiG [Pseudomonas sp.]|uniref:class I SAM-dependent methyltransferase n=1 Tax=Pseudomonas sp. TaxID=306 RepID=UPI002619B3AD|nr:class I SAM-dependent methyltransferase [Pseudomonas sp.]